MSTTESVNHGFKSAGEQRVGIARERLLTFVRTLVPSGKMPLRHHFCARASVRRHRFLPQVNRPKFARPDTGSNIKEYSTCLSSERHQRKSQRLRPSHQYRCGDGRSLQFSVILTRSASSSTMPTPISQRPVGHEIRVRTDLMPRCYLPSRHLHSLSAQYFRSLLVPHLNCHPGPFHGL